MNNKKEFNGDFEKWLQGEIVTDSIVRYLCIKYDMKMDECIKQTIKYVLEKKLEEKFGYVNVEDLKKLSEKEVNSSLSFITKNNILKKYIPRFFKTINFMDLINMYVSTYTEEDAVRYFYIEKLDKNRVLPTGMICGKMEQAYYNFYTMLEIALQREGVDPNVETNGNDILIEHTIDIAFLDKYELLNYSKMFDGLKDLLEKMFGIESAL